MDSGLRPLFTGFGAVCLALAVGVAFRIYDWRREQADANLPALRCDVEPSYGEDRFDVYAVRATSRSRIARGVAGAGPAMSAAALLCPLPKLEP